jgi:hypothetical protein
MGGLDVFVEMVVLIVFLAMDKEVYICVQSMRVSNGLLCILYIVSPLFWSPWSESPAELTLIGIRFHAVGKYLPCMQMLGP